MKKKVIWIDIAAFLGMLLSFMPDLTGLTVHEWLGLAVGGVVLVHLLQHWQWILTVSQGLFHKNSKIVSRFVVDGVLGLDLLVMIGTGLIISSILQLPLEKYNIWRGIHVVSSYGFLTLLGLKIAIHWEWVTKTASRIFSADNGLAAPNMDRRKFFRTCLISGAAFVVAFSEYKEWQRKTAVLDASNNSDEPSPTSVSENENALLNSESPTITPASDNVKETEAASDFFTEETPTPVQSTATKTPEITVLAETNEDAVLVTGVVRCNKGCSFPGRCRKYQDTITKNAKCDLGEAIW